MAPPFDPEAYLSQDKANKFSPETYLNQGSISLFDVPRLASQNFSKSGSKFVSDLVTPFTEPVKTVKVLGSLLLGVAQKVVPDSMTGGPMENEKYADAVGDFFAKRYGGYENIKKTAATDPVGFLSDVATIFSGGGTLAAKLPGIAGRTGKVVANVANNLDPVTMGVKVAGSALKGASNPAVRNLIKEGVSPTLGQVLGGGWKKAEDAISSLPVVGSFQAGGRNRANQQLNAAVYNRVLNPIGKTSKDRDLGIYSPGSEIPKQGSVGTTAVDTISNQLDSAYTNLLPKLELIPDNKLLDDIVEAIEITKSGIGGDPKTVAILKNIIDDKVMSKLDNNVPLDGQVFKLMESELGKLAKQYTGSSNAAERIVGEGLESVQAAIRSSLERTNPKYAGELRAINEGYANYVRLRHASGSTGALTSGGVFTPAQLQSAVRAMDKSVGKGDSARGRALMQDLSKDAVEVMGGNLPTSGTTERAFMSALATGAYTIDPLTGALVAASAVPYAPGVQRKLAQFLTARPELARKVGQGTIKYGPMVTRPAFQSGRLSRELQNMENN